MKRLVKQIAWVVAPLSMLAIAASAAASLHVDDVEWKRIQRFDVGTRVKVTTVGAPAIERYFVQLSDMELIVLNLTAANLPKRQLLNMAVDNPSWIVGTSKTTYRDNTLRIGPDGVFVKDQKIAELAEVVERIPRGKVTSITKA
jgi:hypothetical protein